MVKIKTKMPIGAQAIGGPRYPIAKHDHQATVFGGQLIGTVIKYVGIIQTSGSNQTSTSATM